MFSNSTMMLDDTLDRNSGIRASSDPIHGGAALDPSTASDEARIAALEIKVSKLATQFEMMRKHPELQKIQRDSCMARFTAGVATGGTFGGAVGAVYGTYEAIKYKVPGLLKVRYIGQMTIGSAALFGLYLGAGRLIFSGKSDKNCSCH